MDERPQFHANDASLDRVSFDPRTVPIHDGRAGPARPTLAVEGFQLLQCPTRVQEFRDAAQVARIYPAEITRFIRELTGADAVVVTGAPVLRFAERSPEAGTRDNSRAARLVHIDVSDRAAADFAAQGGPARRAQPFAVPRSTTSGARSRRRRRTCRSRYVMPAPQWRDLVLADARFDKDGTVIWSFEALLLRYNAAHHWSVLFRP